MLLYKKYKAIFMPYKIIFPFFDIFFSILPEKILTKAMNK